MKSDPSTYFITNQVSLARLQHFILNTGHVTWHDLQGVHLADPTAFKLQFEAGRGELPGLPGCGFVLAEGEGCCQFMVGQHGEELVTGGVAWGWGAGACLWHWLQDYCRMTRSWKSNGDCSIPARPPALPWLAVVQHENLSRLSKPQVQALAVAERALALALIHQATTRN